MGNSSVHKGVHPVLVLRPILLGLFVLTPLANLHHFLICALSFLVQRPLVGCLLLCQTIIYDGNVISDLRHFYLRPLFFPETQLGHKIKVGYMGGYQ
jgi:hypothetical protein